MSNHPKAKIETTIGNRLSRGEIKSRIQRWRDEDNADGHSIRAAVLDEVLALFEIGEEEFEPYIHDGWSDV
jgi:hypothetical protein